MPNQPIHQIDLGMVHFENVHHLRLRHIPEATFAMGSNEKEKAFLKEDPIHPVKLSEYYIGIYPVTQALWKAVMGQDNNPSRFEEDDKPVEQVSWEDIMGTEDKAGFLQKLNKLTETSRPAGFEYRLPTEAQWEYAARAEKDYEYAGGNKLKEVAWYHLNSHGETKDVGLKEPNDFGLYDMSGNVFEWCLDKTNGFGEHDFYQKCYKEAQENGKAYVLNPCCEEAQFRVIRGGSWDDYPQYCRVSYRDFYPPTARTYNVGFRLVLSFQLDG